MGEKEISQFINVIKVPVNKYAQMKPTQIWQELARIAKARYNYALPETPALFRPFQLPFMKLALLRDLCLSTGLVLEKKNYDILEGPSLEKSLPFVIKNIVSLEPIPKHMSIQPSKLHQRESESEGYIDKFQVKEALKNDHELERENLYISGGLNEVAVKLYSRMGKVLYILGENNNAIAQEIKNLTMLGCLSSEDHFLTIQSHSNLGLYYLNSSSRDRAIYHFFKALSLMLLSFGETAPDLLITFANLSRAYQLGRDYQQAIECYERAI